MKFEATAAGRMDGIGSPRLPTATITLSCGGNSVKLTTQVKWTGRSLTPRVPSGVFFHPGVCYSDGPALEQAIRHVQEQNGPTVYTIGIFGTDEGRGERKRAERALKAIS